MTVNLGIFFWFLLAETGKDGSKDESKDHGEDGEDDNKNEETP